MTFLAFLAGAHAADLTVGNPPFQQYADVGSAAAAAVSGDRIIVYPGTYDGFIDASGKTLTIESIEIIPDNTILTRTSPFDLFFADTSTLTLRNLTFDGANQATGLKLFDSEATLENCIVRNADGPSGGGITAIRSPLTIVDSHFEGNRSNSQGGAILAVDADIEVQTSSFVDNQAPDPSAGWGGHVYVSDASLTVLDTSFDGGVAGFSGGAVHTEGLGSTYIDGAVLTGNTAFLGGALRCDDRTDCRIANSAFYDNVASSLGGAIHYVGLSGEFDHTLFCNNAAAGMGGAIYTTTSLLSLRNSVLQGSTAPMGGALYGEFYSFVNSTNVNWLGNSASVEGAATWIDYLTSFTATNDLVAGNTGATAMYHQSISHLLTWTAFWDNPSGDHVGAGGSGTFYADPTLSGWPGATCGWQDQVPLPGSPLIDGGNPGVVDPWDGTISDVGALGGADGRYDWYRDEDGDGVPLRDDCDDTNPSVFPGRLEVCVPVGVDDDCDGLVDGDDPLLNGVDVWPDGDGDGYGDYWATPVESCPGSGFVDNDQDCWDADPAQWEGPPWHVDLDGDGLGDPASPSLACEAPYGMIADDSDCDDTDPAVGAAPDWYLDSDGDGFGDSLAATASCAPIAQYVADDSDCDDADSAVNPLAAEVCDGGLDNDCSGAADDADPAVDPSTMSTWYDDLDGDGFGAGVGVDACEPASGQVADQTDCDDTDPGVSPLGTEIPDNGVDEDCDGLDATQETGGTSTGGTSPGGSNQDQAISREVEGSKGNCGCASSSMPAPWTAILLGLLATARRKA